MIISDYYRHRYILLPIVADNAFPVEFHHLGKIEIICGWEHRLPTAEVLVLFYFHQKINK